MRVLVLADHDNSVLNSATSKAVAAACAIGAEVDVLVAGWDCIPVAERAARLFGVSRVLLAESEFFVDPLPETLADQLVALAPGYTHILAAATSTGKGVIPRVAARLGSAQISDVVRVDSADTFTRPVHAGVVLHTVRCDDGIKVLTIRASAFADAGEGAMAPVVDVAAAASRPLSRVVSREMNRSARPRLEDAHVVVAGGRGLASKEQFQALLEPLADRLEGALGATRAAVDLGFAPNDLQIGQTGKIIAPQLYVAVGISGAIQHMAGVKDSRVIVAINKDDDAPVFGAADYCLTGDLFEVIPALTRELGEAATDG